MKIMGVAVLFIAAAAWCAPQPSQTPRSEEPLIRSLNGKQLFIAYCASCHGVDGRGSGPVARELKRRPTDLTHLAARNGGVYPQDRIRQYIVGDRTIAIHGSREMPVWGPIFSRVEEDTDYGKVRVQNLVQYIERLQSR